MKKVLYSDISSTAKQPFLKATHKQYNDAIYEGFKSLMSSITNSDNSTYYIVHGCEISGSYPNVTIAAGAVYYNGEIYQTASTALTTPANITQIGGIITTTYDAVDPVLFSDNNTHNVHQTKTIVWGDIAIIAEDFIYSNTKKAISLQASKGWTTVTPAIGQFSKVGAGSLTSVSGSFVDYKIVGDLMYINVGFNLVTSGSVTQVTLDLSSLITFTTGAHNTNVMFSDNSTIVTYYNAKFPSGSSTIVMKPTSPNTDFQSPTDVYFQAVLRLA